jgi:hypothetical protein
MRNWILICAAFLLGGCLLQPTDAITGEAIGPRVRLGDPVPTTNPATGNPVHATPTKQVDERAVTEGVAAFLPRPYSELATLGLGVLFYELSRRREKRALESPPPPKPQP